MPLPRWPPAERAEIFDEFEIHYRSTAKMLQSSKPRFTPRLARAMEELLEVAKGELARGDANTRIRRDKAMELCLKWHPDNHVQMLVEHSMLATRDEHMLREVQHEEQELRELRRGLEGPLFHVVTPLMTVMEGFAIARDLKDLYTAAFEADRSTRQQFRNVGGPGNRGILEQDILEFGPAEALRRHRREAIAPADARSVTEVPVSAEEERRLSGSFQEAWEGGPENVVQLLITMLRGALPGGGKARHLVRISRAVVQRGGMEQGCELLHHVGVLLLCVMERFHGAAPCKSDYIDLQTWFSSFNADTPPATINFHLSHAFFAPDTLYQARHTGRAPPGIQRGPDQAGAAAAPAAASEPPRQASEAAAVQPPRAEDSAPETEHLSAASVESDGTAKVPGEEPGPSGHQE
mmetsp:Transcript_9011/g.22571  ORF Transcript_9011/g.22571 Transcript_9011/m.22571 type:complete len:408 (+) Transcript_9011:53-1276(+)